MNSRHEVDFTQTKSHNSDKESSPQDSTDPQDATDFKGLPRTPQVSTDSKKNPKRKHTGAAVDFLKNEQVQAAIRSTTQFDAAACKGNIARHVFKELLPSLCRRLRAVSGLCSMAPYSQPLADILEAWHQSLLQSYNPHITPQNGSSKYNKTTISIPEHQKIPYPEHIAERFWSYWDRTVGKEHDWVAMTRELINSRGRDDGTFPDELTALDRWCADQRIARDDCDAAMIGLAWTMAHRDGKRQSFFLSERDAGRYLIELMHGTSTNASAEQVRCRGRYYLAKLTSVGILKVATAGEAGNPRGKATTFEWAWQSGCSDKKPDE